MGSTFVKTLGLAAFAKKWLVMGRVKEVTLVSVEK